MPPKGRKPKGKLHVLAIALNPGTIITDTRKQSFIIEKEFAQGGFGRIYSAHMKDSRKFEKDGSLAVKVEPKANGPLFTEITVFQRILKLEMLKQWQQEHKIEHLGLPMHVGSGIFVYQGDELRFLAMPKYSRSFESYRSECGGKVDASIALQVARQCADSLAYMQDQDYVHADLKADNILLESEKDFSRCYLVDFGLARMVKGDIDKPDKKRAHNGTLIFTSIDAHRGSCPSPRGDLEILAYNLLYWLAGYLPWQNCESNPDSVFSQKTEFSKSVEQSVKNMIKENVADCIVQLLEIAYQSPYTQRINYDTVRKNIDTALKNSRVPRRSARKSETNTFTKQALPSRNKEIKSDKKLTKQPETCLIAPVISKRKRPTATTSSEKASNTTHRNVLNGEQSSLSMSEEPKHFVSNVKKHSSRARKISSSSDEPSPKRPSLEKQSSESRELTTKASNRRKKNVNPKDEKTASLEPALRKDCDGQSVLQAKTVNRNSKQPVSSLTNGKKVATRLSREFITDDEEEAGYVNVTDVMQKACQRTSRTNVTDYFLALQARSVNPISNQPVSSLTNGRRIATRLSKEFITDDEEEAGYVYVTDDVEKASQSISRTSATDHFLVPQTRSFNRRSNQPVNHLTNGRRRIASRLSKEFFTDDEEEAGSVNVTDDVEKPSQSTSRTNVTDHFLDSEGSLLKTSRLNAGKSKTSSIIRGGHNMRKRNTTFT